MYETVAMPLLAGSVAGAASWLFTMPMDVIKSVHQASPHDSLPTYRNICLTGWRAGKIGYFFRGVWPTVGRSVLVNACLFPAYEYIYNFL